MKRLLFLFLICYTLSGLSQVPKKDIITSNPKLKSAGCQMDFKIISGTCEKGPNGNYIYNYCATLQDISTISGTTMYFNDPLTFNCVNGTLTGCTSTSLSDLIKSPNGSVSYIGIYPHTIPKVGIVTVCFKYTPSSTSATTALFKAFGVCATGTSTSANASGSATPDTTVTLPSCVCDFCKGLEWDNDPPTINIISNNLNIRHPVWVMVGGSTTVVSAKAEIISFERYINDVCMPCDKNFIAWGNFVSGAWGTNPATFGNANGGITGNTHHSLYWTTGTSTDFNLIISLPPLSGLDCCCEKFVVNVRYTFTLRDQNGVCKMCSQIMRYEKSKGVCTANPNTTNNPSNN